MPCFRVILSPLPCQSGTIYFSKGGEDVDTRARRTSLEHKSLPLAMLPLPPLKTLCGTNYLLVKLVVWAHKHPISMKTSKLNRKILM